MPIGAIATLRTAPGKAAHLEQLFDQLAPQIRAEPGARLCQLLKSRDEPGVYVIVEFYADDRALADHAQTPHVQLASPALMELLAGPPEVAFYDFT